MRYLLKQKIFSFGGDFTIRDASGNDVLHVDGKVFALGRRLIVEDMTGAPLALIRQKLLSFAPTYLITQQDRLVATVRKKLFTFFRCRFTIDVPGPDDFLVEGDFFDHEYVFSRHGHTVAVVSKKWFTFADTYAVDITDGEDDLLMLCCTIAIAEACKQRRRH